jgi:hypothetical protein
VTLIALASIKGSPGVTTAATALAASWPEGRQVLLVEADPFGGDLAPATPWPSPEVCPRSSPRHGAPSSPRTSGPRRPSPRGSSRCCSVWGHAPGRRQREGLADRSPMRWRPRRRCRGRRGRLLPNLGGGVREVLARGRRPGRPVPIRRSRPSSICGRHCPGWPPRCEAAASSSSPPEPPSSRRPTSHAPSRSRCGQPMPDDPGAAAALANRRSDQEARADPVAPVGRRHDRARWASSASRAPSPVHESACRRPTRC